MNSNPNEVEPIYVVDTQAIIWYLTDNSKLSPAAKYIFSAAEQGLTKLVVPTIVLAELHYGNKKWHWFESYSILKQLIVDLGFIRFLAFEADDIDDFDQDASVPEMHDRIIAGVARRLQAPLITSDLTIRASTIVTSVW